MQFDLQMKDMNINGTVLLLYHNFRVSAIDPETRDTTGIFKNIKTEIANRIVLKSDNHNLFGNPVRVSFSRAYETNYFITNNIIKTIITGIKKSVK
jgi:hypothetical protein